MAETSEKATGGVGNKVPYSGDHDRVQMLSVRADGVPDQHNPEFIGDKDAALEATKEQFRQQAVSAVDVQERGVSAAPLADDVAQDPGIEELQKKHDQAAKAAESAAESAVNSLTNDKK